MSESAAGVQANQPAEPTAVFDSGTGTLKIGDMELTVDQIKNGVMMQQDYTKKTQELSLTRKQIEEQARKVKEFEERVLAPFEGLPEATKAEILAKINGGAATQSATADLSGIEWQGNEQMLFNEMQKLARQNGELRDLLGTVKPVLNDLTGFVASTKAERSALDAATDIQERYGMKVSPQELVELSKSSGLPPKAAWLMENEGRLVSSAIAKGKEEASAKPNAPLGMGQAWSAKGKSPEELADAINRGYNIQDLDPRIQAMLNQ